MTDFLTGQSIDAARRTLTTRFSAAGIDSAALDARLLAGAALHLDLTGLIAQGARQLTREDADRLEAFALRRIAGEPVARILGAREFWGLPLTLSADTLVPRPDTETIVEAALETLRAEGRGNDALRIADLGTGTGAILLALLTELPNATGIGTDLSAAGIETATANARHLGLAPRADFIVSDYAENLSGAFDLIVSNPPYIRSADIAALAVEPFAAFMVRFRRHLDRVEKVMGALLVLTGVAFLTGWITTFSYWLLDAFPALGTIG